VLLGTWWGPWGNPAALGLGLNSRTSFY